jgi:hypothetical protein
MTLMKRYGNKRWGEKHPNWEIRRKSLVGAGTGVTPGWPREN